MKFITKSEYNRIAGVTDPRAVYEALASCRNNMAVFVSKSEWTYKMSPSEAINSFASNNKDRGVERLRVSSTETPEGWAILRK